MRVQSDRRYIFPAPADDVWRAATSVERYDSWWTWLRAFDGTAFDTGAVWMCLVKPPLPYTVRLVVTLEDVRAPRSVRASVAGDVTGTAELTIVDTEDGCEARLVSDLAPSRGMLRVLAALARPVVRRGHDWVLDTGARQFTQVALAEADPDPVA